jgi:hypothetical protein
MKDDVNGKFRILYEEQIRNLYRSSRVVKIVESKRLSWDRLVNRTWRQEQRTGVGNLFVKRQLARCNFLITDK